jgi:hypothetical protein
MCRDHARSDPPPPAGDRIPSPRERRTDFMNAQTAMNEARRMRPRESQRKIERSEIAQRAYELWIGARRPAGRDLEFWLQAEAELMAARRAHPRKAGAPNRSEGKNA